MLEKSVVEKCWGRVLERSVGEECCGWCCGEGKESWGRLLEKSFGEECCREVLESSVIEKCWSSQNRQEMPTNAQLFEYDLFI